MSLPDVNNIYHVPGMLVHQKLHSILRKELNLKIDEPDLREWQEVADSIDNFTKTVQICIVGKYNGLQGSYLSILKALKVCVHYTLPLYVANLLLSTLPHHVLEN